MRGRAAGGGGDAVIAAAPGRNSEFDLNLLYRFMFPGPIFAPEVSI